MDGGQNGQDAIEVDLCIGLWCGMGFEFMEKVSDGFFGEGGYDVAEDEEIVEEIAFFFVEVVLEGFDAVEGAVDEDLMLGHIIIIEEKQPR